MRVMTFNLRCDTPLDFCNRWNNRKSMVYHILNDYNCDIIGIQEVTYNMHMDLMENVNEYHIVGVSRSKKASSERNNILISKVHSISEHKTFWLSETPDKVGSHVWYSYVPRICTTAVVQMVGKEKVRIYNTHLDNLLQHTRRYGLKKLMEIVEQDQEKEKLPIILMGDFNDTPDSKLIQDFKAGEFSKIKLTPVQDVNEALYDEVTRDKFARTNKGVHIDYIFVSEEISVVNAEIVKYNVDNRYPSDHYPLTAELTIDKRL